MFNRLRSSPGLPPGQVLTRKFPVLTYGPIPQVEPHELRLKVEGLVKHKEFSWEELMALPQAELSADFHCVTRWSRPGLHWKGIRVLDLMEHVELDPEARSVLVSCYGGYTTSLPLEDFLHPDNLLAHTLEGSPLPREHGGPLRLLVPHRYGWKSAKWVHSFRFNAGELLGFWEVNGYHERGDPWREERYSE